MADADPDGKHIVGLTLCMFHTFWPELLQNGYVTMDRTPCYRATLGRQSLSFYTEGQLLRWQQENPELVKKYKIWVMKGLGSSDDDNAKVDAQNPYTVTFNHDDCTDEYMINAFHKDKVQTNIRKTWIDAYTFMPEDESLELPISNFITREFLQFAVVNVRRNLPAIDGLKLTTRKAIYGTIKQWKYKVNVDQIKVAQLGAKAIDVCGYRYGEKSMYRGDY